MAVQQGAGMVVTKSDEAREKAAVTFLKWFTAPEQNVRFAMSSGYLPVTYEGNSQSADVYKRQILCRAGVPFIIIYKVMEKTASTAKNAQMVNTTCAIFSIVFFVL